MKAITYLFLLLFVSTGSIAQTTVPYYTDFETASDTMGWSHYSLSGTDDWEWGVPNSVFFDEAYSDSMVFATNLLDLASSNSVMVLETPTFDLSDTNVAQALQFYHRRHTVSGGASYYFEYSTDNGANWQLLDDPDAASISWQGQDGFTGYDGFNSVFRRALIDIGFLQGPPQIKFRFRCVTGSTSQDGWMIDDFSIGQEFFNVTAHQGDTITGFNKLFDEFTVESEFGFLNHYYQPYSFQNDFYLSTDQTIDGNDIFLGSVIETFNSTNAEWSNTFPLPQNLSAGTYYIIYQLDVANALVDEIENDNTAFTVMVVDSIYAAPYINDFEDLTDQTWNTGIFSNPTSWRVGDPNNWHIEDARGKRGWYSGQNIAGQNYLESPYIDLSESDTNVVCFWYRNGSAYETGHTFKLSGYVSANPIDYSWYPSGSNYETELPKERIYGWDCFCKDVSLHDGNPSFQFMIEGAAGNLFLGGTTGSVIDDIYVGEAKPDISLEQEKFTRFTGNDRLTDTLHYVTFNSGLKDLPATTTDFYWSTDSLYDPSDVYLGSNTEPMLTDTAFQWNYFVYDKQSQTNGTFYIVYRADANNEVDEMREYDNTGYFKITQETPYALPYYNDFETEVNGWKHSATLGTDDWEWDIPNGVHIDTAFSGVKAWVTNAQGIVSEHSRSHLYTPIFDLSELDNPVIEWDLLLYRTGVDGYTPWPYNLANIMYSTDGGAKWIRLDTTNLSFKRMYNELRYSSIHGSDNQWVSNIAHTLYGGKLEPTFRNQIDYQGRDYDENYRYVVDLKFLQSHSQVRFMFVYSNIDAPMEGMMMDNFNIRESATDLMSKSEKTLMVSSSDHRITQNLRITNDDNYISEETTLDIYCSETMDLNGPAAFLTSVNVPKLRPYQSFTFILDTPTPADYGDFRYLALDIDPQNQIAESDETNNTHYLGLGMDTAHNYEYPVLFDFEDIEFEGWSWYHDSTGYRHGFRFHTTDLTGQHIFPSSKGFIELDLIYYYNQTDLGPYPTYYLISPPYSFNQLSFTRLSFDLFCLGNNYNQGANLQYSTDGGITWEVLTDDHDPNAQNWYNSNNVASLNSEPGWTNYLNFANASIDLTFLSGQPDVRFRFKFKAIVTQGGPPIGGLKLDNFLLEETDGIIEFPEDSICFGDSISVFGSYVSAGGQYFQNLQTIHGYDSLLIQSVYVDTVVFDVEQNGLMLIAHTESNCTYAWLDCNSNYQPITNEVDSIFIAPEEGNFAVQVEHEGCVVTSDCYQLTAINEAVDSGELVVFPNPTNSILQIRLPPDALKPTRTYVYEMTGRLVHQQSFSSIMQVGFLSNGTYLLLVQTEKNTFRLLFEKQ